MVRRFLSTLRLETGVSNAGLITGSGATELAGLSSGRKSESRLEDVMTRPRRRNTSRNLLRKSSARLHWSPRIAQQIRACGRSWCGGCGPGGRNSHETRCAFGGSEHHVSYRLILEDDQFLFDGGKKPALIAVLHDAEQRQGLQDISDAPIYHRSIAILGDKPLVDVFDLYSLKVSDNDSFVLQPQGFRVQPHRS